MTDDQPTPGHVGWSPDFQSAREQLTEQLRLANVERGEGGVINGMNNSAEIPINTARETDGRWIAECLDVPGALVYGASEAEALKNLAALLADIVVEERAAADAAPGGEGRDGTT